MSIRCMFLGIIILHNRQYLRLPPQIFECLLSYESDLVSQWNLFHHRNSSILQKKPNFFINMHDNSSAKHNSSKLQFPEIQLSGKTIPRKYVR